jgi:hypothetical protein
MLVCTLLDCPTAKHMSYYCFYHVYWKESKTTISTCWLKFPVIIVFLFSLDAINLQTNIHIIWHIEHASEIVENSRKPWSTFSGNFSLFVSTTADEWMPMCCRKIVQPFSLLTVQREDRCWLNFHTTHSLNTDIPIGAAYKSRSTTNPLRQTLISYLIDCLWQNIQQR